MRVNRDADGGAKFGLSRATLREMERKLGVFLDSPRDPIHAFVQQFGVYDEQEEFAGDIFAKNRFFSEEELESAIRELFEE